MCDYCGCRQIGPIADLTEDHQLVIRIGDALRHALAAGGEAAAAPGLTLLQAVLEVHLRKEEEGIFHELADHPAVRDYLGRLAGDHLQVRGGLLAIDAKSQGWADDVLEALDELAAHIAVEEYDLFPASQMLVDDAGWATIAEVHQRVGVANGTGSAAA